MDPATIARNAKRQSDARDRLIQAVNTSNTIDEAITAYGTNRDVFFRALRRNNLTETAKADLGWSPTTRKAGFYDNTADLIEDAEFLARHGVDWTQAATRLGYNSKDSLYYQLVRIKRTDLSERFTANTDPDESGHLRAGSIAGPTHGSRL